MVDRVPLAKAATCNPEEHVSSFFDPLVYRTVESRILRTQVLWFFATASLVPGSMLMSDRLSKELGPESSSRFVFVGMIV